MDMLNIVNFSRLVTGSRPYAAATLRGSEEFPNISGTVRFYVAAEGTLVVAEVFNLPHTQRNGPFHGFHLHEGPACGSGGGSDPFSQAGNHYNPTGDLHPGHVGDFPPLLANNGYAYISFFTDYFPPETAVGKVVVVHQNGDDFLSQPGGNAGKRIACGVVER